MESLQIRPTESGLHVDGYPDAVKLIRIEGPKAVRIADLVLHKHDLSFCRECLDRLAYTPREDSLLQEALWSSAIVHFYKCFGGGVRSALNADSIYAGNEIAKNCFGYFQALRNKHVVHDVNAYADCKPSAILNREDAMLKIAKIVGVSLHAQTLDQPSFSNLSLLISEALAAVEKEFDTLCDEVTKELEQIPYSDLSAKDSIILSAPTLAALYGARAAGNAPGRARSKKKKNG